MTQKEEQRNGSCPYRNKSSSSPGAGQNDREHRTRTQSREALQEAHRGDNLEIPPILPLAQGEYGVQRNLASL